LYFPLPAPITPSAMTLEFLKSPPGNHLERLTRDREGQYSIRINQEWRVCFV
jgi:proteic killer suppression protein